MNRRAAEIIPLPSGEREGPIRRSPLAEADGRVRGVATDPHPPPSGRGVRIRLGLHSILGNGCDEEWRATLDEDEHYVYTVALR